MSQVYLYAPHTRQLFFSFVLQEKKGNCAHCSPHDFYCIARSCLRAQFAFADPGAFISSVGPWPWGMNPKPLGRSSATKVNYVSVMHYVEPHSADNQSLSSLGPRHTPKAWPHSSPIPLCREHPFPFLTISASPCKVTLERRLMVYLLRVPALRCSQDNRMLLPNWSQFVFELSQNA